MPARYIGIRDSLMEKGVPEQDAKAQAAQIYNSTRREGEAVLTKDYDKKHPYKGKSKKKGK